MSREDVECTAVSHHHFHRKIHGELFNPIFLARSAEAHYQYVRSGLRNAFAHLSGDYRVELPSYRRSAGPCDDEPGIMRSKHDSGSVRCAVTAATKDNNQP